MSGLSNLFSRSCSGDVVITTVLSMLIGLVICGVVGVESPMNILALVGFGLVNILSVGVLRCLDGRNEQIQLLRDDKAQMKSKIRRLQDNVTRGEEEKAKLLRQISTIEREFRCQSVQVRVDNSNEQLHRAERSAHEWQIQCRDTSARVMKLDRKLAESEERCSQLARDKIRIQEEKLELEESVFSVQERENSRLHEMNQMRMRVTELNEENEELTSKCQELEAEMKSVIKKMTQSLTPDDSGFGDDLNTSLASSYSIEYTTLTEATDGIVAAIRDERHTIDLLNRDTDDSKRKIKSLEDELGLCNAEVDKQRSENRNKEQQLQTLQEQFSKLKNDNGTLMINVFQLDRQSKDLIQKYSELQLTAQQQEEKIKHLGAELVKMTNRCELAEKGVKGCETEKKKIENEKGELESKNGALSRDLDVKNQELEKLQEKCVELERAKDTLENDISLLREHVDDVDARLQEKQEQLEEKTQKLKKLEHLQTFKLYINKIGDTTE